jgi:hypothetical protein
MESAAVAWVKLDDNCMEHPKIAQLSNGAIVLWLAGLCHCQRFLTDGKIEKRSLFRLKSYSDRRSKEIQKCALWSPTPGGGIIVHDYLAYQLSRAEVTQRREDARIRMGKLRGASSQNVPANKEESSQELRDSLHDSRPGPYVRTQSEGTSTRRTKGLSGGTARAKNARAKPSPPSQPQIDLQAAETAIVLAPVAKPHPRVPRRVVFDGQRVQVWDWMHEEFSRRLGAKAEDFNLIDWYCRIDKALTDSGEDYAEPFKMLLERLYEDAHLELPNLSSRSKTAGNAAALEHWLSSRRDHDRK